MKKTTIGFLALVLAAPVCSVRAGSAETPWKTLAASGRVETRAATSDLDEWSRVQRGDKLTARAQLRTGRRGRATFSRQADLLIVDPGSQLELPERGSGTATQRRGTVIYEIDSRQRDGFRVETPHLVAGVKGTVFLVAVDGRGAAVTVREGTVEVTSTRTGERLELGAGETLVLRASDADEVERIERVSRGEGRGAVSGAARRTAWRHSERLEEADREQRFLARGRDSEPEHGSGPSPREARGGDDDDRVADARIDDDDDDDALSGERAADELDEVEVDPDALGHFEDLDDELPDDEELGPNDDDEMQDLVDEQERRRRQPPDDGSADDPQ